MSHTPATVRDLSPGESARVLALRCAGALRRRIIDMGITPGAVVVMRKTAPLGDPIEINIRGYELSIRKTEAEQILVESAGLPRNPVEGRIWRPGKNPAGRE